MSTASTVMTGRERMNAALEGRDHDRVPRYETFWGETVQRWKQEGYVPQDKPMLFLYDLLESDIAGVFWTWPSPYGGEELIEEDDQTKLVRDQHGKIVRLWKHRSGTPEHHGFGCQTREDWESKYKPMIIERNAQIDIAPVVEAAAKGHAQGKWVKLSGIEGFEATRALIGDEVALMAMIEDPDWIKDISDTYVDLTIQSYQRIVDAGAKIDGLWVFGDMAYNHATMCSPAMYDQLMRPGHKRLVEWAHDRGMKFIYHTDGDVNGVMDMYLDNGFDGLHPLEAKANMDIRKLADTVGDKLTFFGNIDVMLMGENNLEKLEEEVVTKLQAGMKHKRYIYHSDHSVPPSCDFATWKFVIELVKEHGNY